LRNKNQADINQRNTGRILYFPGMDSTAWFRRAVIYQVFIDRFNGVRKAKNTTDFLGGNLRGVTDKLDYLKDLGIDVIWLSPFYESQSYHGYHITDFKKVDPHFGDLDDLKGLVEKAKRRGMRVIADLVPNHCSVSHSFFKDAVHSRDSSFRDWFIFERWPDRYLSFLDFKELPKINLDHPEAREYIIGVGEYWLSMGLDGFRLDHVIGPSHAFWKAFRHEVGKKFPEAVLVGEAWASGLERRYFNTTGIRKKMRRRLFGISQEKIQLEYASGLHGVLDFALQGILQDAVSQGLDPLTDPQIRRRISLHFKKVPPGFMMVTFLDSHDMNRFIRYCQGDVKLLLRAFEALFSLDYPVVLYNGTENCIPNKHDVSIFNPYSDLQVRAPVDWNKLNQQFLEGFRSLAQKRQDLMAG
jgi:cyclomaltodextrinase